MTNITKLFFEKSLNVHCIHYKTQRILKNKSDFFYKIKHSSRAPFHISKQNEITNKFIFISTLIIKHI